MWRLPTLTANGHPVPAEVQIDMKPFDASRYGIRGRVLYVEARVQF
ncbi:hypothetical protein [Sphingomonas sp. BK345]|nr:hypothetical protein [Sphingomonas sp. BK345]MBB3475431.1 hypothetical protein [Sphingomonas sp. BK345]